MNFKKLYTILNTLRGPSGCKWDKEQTPLSLKANLIEECYELIDAINSNDINNIKEELGDLYLVITMLVIIYEEQALFKADDVLNSVCEKLINRHPHVFVDNITADTAEESLAIWQQQKAKEKNRKEEGYLDRIGKSLPPLERAMAIEDKMIKAGYYFDSIDEAVSKLNEEIIELKDEIISGDKVKAFQELGDVLLTTVSLANHLNINPSEALTYANNKVISRFNYVVNSLQKQNLALERNNIDKMEEAWQEAKKLEPNS